MILQTKYSLLFSQHIHTHMNFFVNRDFDFVTFLEADILKLKL